MSKNLKKFIKTKKLPIILGSLLALFVAVFIIGLISASLSGGSGIKVVSAQNIFQSDETPQFIFIYKKQANIFNRIITGLRGFFTSKSIKINASVKIFDSNSRQIDGLNPQIKQEKNGKLSVELDHSHFQQELRPGQYEMVMEITDNGKTYTQTQDFYWGVLAINTNKSIYAPNEQVYLQFASLDKEGHTLCNSKLELQIQTPNSKTQILSTNDGTIKYSGTCKGDNVTDVPDYFAYYNVSETGKYEMKLTNLDTGFEITDYFEVRDSVEFDVERSGPTRIWPYAKYEVKIKIKANQDFKGEIVEIVPMTFIIEEKLGAKIEPNSDNYTKTVAWQAEIKKGESKEFVYIFDAPNVSPYFYLIGPLKLLHVSGYVFHESRQWQVAVDSETEVWITYDTAPSDSCGTNCWTVPGAWDSASNSVEVIGGGGTGGDGSTSNGAGGGGGGGYSKVSNLDITGNITFAVGASGSAPASTGKGGNGGNTWFNSSSYSQCFTDGTTKCVSALGGEGGGGSGTGLTGGIGGTTATASGTVKYTGGSGGVGSSSDGSGGGGGAGGPHATDGNAHNGGPADGAEGAGGGGAGGGSATDGLDSGNPNAGEGGNGGTGYSGAAGGDGAATPAAGAIGTTPGAGGGGGDQTGSTSGTNGGAGAIGQQWDSTHGSGGGGGGAGDSGTQGGNGGLYGGGGGGGASCNSANRCMGAGGLIHIAYTPLSFTVSGTCKQYDQSTNSTEAATIKVAVNTSVNGTTASCSAGAWTVTLSSFPVIDDNITVWVDNVDDTYEAVAVTRYDGSGATISGIGLYERHLFIGSDDNTFASSSDLATYDYSVSTDEDIFFDASATSLNTCVVGGCENAELYIAANNKYALGSASAGFAEIHDIEIDGTFNLTGTGNYASISGSWNNDYNFTPGTSTIFFMASDSTELVSQSTDGTYAFNNVQFGDNTTTSYTGHWDFNGNVTAFDVNGNLAIEGGAMHGNKTTTLAGNLTIELHGDYLRDNYTFTFDGTGTSTWTDNKTSNKSDMGAVSINGTSKSINIAGVYSTHPFGGKDSGYENCSSGTDDDADGFTDVADPDCLSGPWVKVTSMNIAAGQILDLTSTSGIQNWGGAILTITGSGQGGSRPFINSGTLDCGGKSTVEYISAAATDIESTNYFSLRLASASSTFYINGAGSNITASGSFIVYSGTFNGGDDTVTLKNIGTGVFRIGDTFTPATGTINYAGNGNTTIASGSYYNLQIGNITTNTADRTYTLQGDTTVSNVLTVGAASGTYKSILALGSTTAYTLTLSGTVNPLVINTYGRAFQSGVTSGTVKFTGDGATNIPVNSTYPYGYRILEIGSSNANNVTYTVTGNIRADILTVKSAASSYVNTLDVGSNNLTVGCDFDVTCGSINVETRAALKQSSSGTTTAYAVSSGSLVIGGAGNTQFYNLITGDTGSGFTGAFTLASDIGVSGSFSTTDVSGGASAFSLSSYELAVYGDFTVGSNTSLSAQTGTINFGGTGNTTYTNSGSSEPYNLTINKPDTGAHTDNVTLASALTVRNTLTITNGRLVQGNYDVRAEATGGGNAVYTDYVTGCISYLQQSACTSHWCDWSTGMCLNSRGEWRNIGTGDLTLGGTFANSGTVVFNTSNNGCTSGGIADDIAITSTAGGTQRNWTSTVPIEMYNVSVTDMTSAADILAYSSTFSNVGPNWALVKCSNYSTPYNRIEGSTRIKGGTRVK